jgi:hypothetical protein
MELICCLENARQVREATGENPLPPVRKWPVALIDAAKITWQERVREHNARVTAESEETTDA